MAGREHDAQPKIAREALEAFDGYVAGSGVIGVVK
jgi:hypothetical protein